MKIKIKIKTLNVSYDASENENNWISMKGMKHSKQGKNEHKTDSQAKMTKM